MSKFDDADRFAEYIEKACSPLGCGLGAHELQWMFRTGGPALIAENKRMRAAINKYLSHQLSHQESYVVLRAALQQTPPTK